MKPSDPMPDDELRALWKRQPSTVPRPSLAQTRSRALAFKARARKRVLAGWVCATLVIGLLLWHAIVDSDQKMRLGHVMIALGVVIGAGFLGRRWPRDVPGESASVHTVLEFHAAEIARQKQSVALVVVSVMLAAGGLCMMLFSLWQRDSHPRIAVYAPLVALLIVWIAGYGAWQRRRARQLKQGLDDIEWPPRN